MADGTRGPGEIPGPRKAAILMVSVDSEAASRLMGQLDKAEQERVALEIVRLEDTPPSKDERERILREFYQISVLPMMADAGGSGTALRLLEKIHPSAEAKRIVESAETVLGRRHFEFLRKADPENLVTIVGEEHPQLIALVLSHLPPDKAAKIVECLPLAKQ